MIKLNLNYCPYTWDGKLIYAQGDHNLSPQRHRRASVFLGIPFVLPIKIIKKTEKKSCMCAPV